jgi:dephospho-CoA kinase
LIEEAIKRKLLGKKFRKDDEKVKNIISKLGNELRSETGKMEILAIKVVDKIKKLKLKKVCIDGFRSPEEVIYFRKNFDNFFLILVKAKKDLRFKRRKNLDPTLTRKKFEEREKLDRKKGLFRVLGMYDFLVENNPSFSELYKKIDDLIKLLIK